MVSSAKLPQLQYLFTYYVKLMVPDRLHLDDFFALQIINMSLLFFLMV